jgi:hypothetical protein
MKRITVEARYKGIRRKGLTPGQTYNLDIRNRGAQLGESAGPHDWVVVKEIGFGYPCTVRGFLSNWEIIHVEPSRQV